MAEATVAHTTSLTTAICTSTNVDDVSQANIPPQLETVVRSLKAHFAAAAQAPRSGPLGLPPVDNFTIASVLQKFAASTRENFHEWEQYLFWNDVHYTRNLVYSCDDFELIVLCWGPGHASRIHNHDKSHCWLSVLSGVVSEQLYQPVSIQSDATLSLRTEAENPSAPNSSCPMLLLLREAIRKEGEVGYINDSLSLHRVANCRISNRDQQEELPPLTPGSVTLHLYAPPIRRVKIFEPGEQKVYARTPGFFSIHGKKH